MDFLESRSFPKVALHRDTKIRDRNLRVAGDERVFLLKLLSRHLATRQTLLVPRTRPALVALQCLEADRLHFHEGNLAVKPRRVKPREHFPQPAPVSEPGPAARHAQAQAGHDKAAMVTRSPGFHGGHFVFRLPLAKVAVASRRRPSRRRLASIPISDPRPTTSGLSPT